MALVAPNDSCGNTLKAFCELVLLSRDGGVEWRGHTKKTSSTPFAYRKCQSKTFVFLKNKEGKLPYCTCGLVEPVGIGPVWV